MLTGISTHLFPNDTKQVVWRHIPRFAIVSGKNGSGKTRLLEKIQQNIQGSDNRTKITWSKGDRTKRSALYIKVDHDFADLTNISQRNTGIDGPTRQLVDTIFGLRDKPDEIETRPGIKSIVLKIEGKAKRGIKDLTREQITRNLPSDALAIFQADANNLYIAQAVEFHGRRLTSFIADFAIENNRRPSEEELRHAVGESPVDTINGLFEEFDFHFSMPPYLRDQTYVVRFVDKRNGQEISFSELSTGEKIIINVIFWASSSHLNHTADVFVLDEIDAHLHPAITKTLMRALKEHVTERCGIQVIMSTHSPTTIAYADDDSIFHLARDRTIQPAAKDELIRELTDNFIAITNREIPLLMDIGNVDSDKIALFVEGPADFKIIKNAATALRWNNDKAVLIPAFGHQNIKNLLVHSDDLLRPYQAKGYIGLIDYDNAFISFRNATSEHKLREHESLSSERQQIWVKEKDIFLLTLPRPDFRFNLASPAAEICRLEIEHLFTDDILRPFAESKLIFGAETYPSIHKKKKIGFAEHTKTLAPNSFLEFQPLFDSIDSVINEIR